MFVFHVVLRAREQLQSRGDEHCCRYTEGSQREGSKVGPIGYVHWQLYVIVCKWYGIDVALLKRPSFR